MTSYWKHEDKDRVIKWLEPLLSHREPHAWGRAPTFEVQLLAALGAMKRSVRVNKGINWLTLRDAINLCIDRKETSLEAVEQALTVGSESRSRSSSTSSTTHTVCFAFELGSIPFSRPGSVDLSGFTSLGLEYRVGYFYDPHPFGDLCLPIHDAASRFAFRVDDPPRIATVDVEADSAEVAMRDAMKGLAAWRHTLSYVMAGETTQVQTVPTRRSAVPPPRWVFCVEDDVVQFLPGFEGVAFKVPNRPGMVMNTDQLSRTQAILDELFVESDANSLDSVLSQAIILFGIAMDQEGWHLAVLGLWQVAELISAIEPQENHTKICSRIASLQTKPWMRPDQVNSALQVIMEIRHDVAHKENVAVAHDIDVDFLASACYGAIESLRLLRDRLTTRRHLKAYFEYSSRPRSDLVTISEVIGVVSGR